MGDTTGDIPLEDVTVRAFELWKVGRKGIDDGVVLFFFAKDHKVRIEVGYGLEDKVPDAAASGIIGEVIVPRIRAGDPDGAVTAGVEAVVARIDGKLPPGERAPPARPAPSLSIAQTILLILALIGLIAFLAAHPSLPPFLLISSFSSRRAAALR